MPCFEPVITTAVGVDEGSSGRRVERPCVMPSRLVANIWMWEIME